MFKKDNRIGFKKEFRANKSAYLFGLPFTAYVVISASIGSVYLLKWALEFIKFAHVYFTTR